MGWLPFRGYTPRHDLHRMMLDRPYAVRRPKIRRRHRTYHLAKHRTGLSNRSWVPGFRLGGAKPPPSLFGGD